MKKLGNKILNILLIVAVVSLVASLASVFSKKSEKKETAEQTYEYTISYRMVLDGELEEIPEEELAALKTVGDCVRYLGGKLNG